MGVRFASTCTNVQVNAMPSGTTQANILQSPPIVLATDGAQVNLTWMLNLTAGTLTTQITVQLLRGPAWATGPLATNWYTTVVAAKSYLLSGSYVDQPGGGVFQYALVIVQNSGSSASTYIDGALLAFVL